MAIPKVRSPEHKVGGLFVCLTLSAFVLGPAAWDSGSLMLGARGQKRSAALRSLCVCV